MRYTDDVIDEVRSQCDIVDVIGKYVELRKKGENYFGCCPFHSEKTPSFVVSQRKQIFHCFGSDIGGDVFKFLMQYNHLSFPEAVKILAERAEMLNGFEEPLERRNYVEAVAAKFNIEPDDLNSLMVSVELSQMPRRN